MIKLLRRRVENVDHLIQFLNHFAFACYPTMTDFWLQFTKTKSFRYVIPVQPPQEKGKQKQIWQLSGAKNKNVAIACKITLDNKKKRSKKQN